MEIILGLCLRIIIWTAVVDGQYLQIVKLSNLSTHNSYKSGSKSQYHLSFGNSLNFLRNAETVKPLGIHKQINIFPGYFLSTKFNRAKVDEHKKPVKILQILEKILTVTNLKFLPKSLKVDTIVLYGYEENMERIIQIFTDKHPPFVILTYSWDQQLKDFLSSNILSIVMLRAESSFTSPLLKTVKKSLNSWNLKKLVLITDTLIKDNENQFLDIFAWLHDKGFWNSLLLDVEGNSLAFDHIAKKFMHNCTLGNFLKNDISWSNLQGYPINCFVGSNPPRVFIYRNKMNQVSLKGYYGTIINLFVRHYNATLNLYVLADFEYYTEFDCVKYISEQKVDICGDALSFDPEFIITEPEEISASYLMVPYDKPLERFYYFLKPFQLHVWAIVCSSFFYKMLTVSFIHRMQHGTWNASLQILYAVLSVMYLPFQLTHVKGWYRKFMELIMICIGFVIANWYLSVLSSLLFTRLYSHNIDSLQDLRHHNISIMVNEFEQYILNTTKNDPIIMQQLQVVPNDILLYHRRNLDPQYAYYSQYDKIKFFLHQQKFLLRPRMKVLSGIHPINEVMAGIPMKPDWPFQKLLNSVTRRIFESGLYQPILENAMEGGVLMGYLQYFPTEHHYVEPLTIEYFQMPAMLLAVGYSLALMGFLLETFVFQRI